VTKVKINHSFSSSLFSIATPTDVCLLLNDLYSIFDRLLERYDAYKVETIGDAYMVVSGAPRRNDTEVQLRMGIHSGPVCAGVIGCKMPRYCFFGNTVHVANQMESNGLPERIQLSYDTYQLLTNREDYQLEERGDIILEGKGLIRTYFLLGK
jgi:class 3 adenylate cyclase